MHVGCIDLSQLLLQVQALLQEASTLPQQLPNHMVVPALQDHVYPEHPC